MNYHAQTLCPKLVVSTASVGCCARVALKTLKNGSGGCLLGQYEVRVTKHKKYLYNLETVWKEL